VSQREVVPTALTPTARSRLRLTQQELAEPQGESLFADPLRSVEQKTGWEGPTVGRVGESLSKRVVAVQGDERHGRNMPTLILPRKPSFQSARAPPPAETGRAQRGVGSAPRGDLVRACVYHSG